MSHRNWTTERRKDGTVHTEAGEEREERGVLGTVPHRDWKKEEGRNSVTKTLEK